jgi:hypothetical protein
MTRPRRPTGDLMFAVVDSLQLHMDDSKTKRRSAHGPRTKTSESVVTDPSRFRSTSPGAVALA